MNPAQPVGRIHMQLERPANSVVGDKPTQRAGRELDPLAVAGPRNHPARGAPVVPQQLIARNLQVNQCDSVTTRRPPHYTSALSH